MFVNSFIITDRILSSKVKLYKFELRLWTFLIYFFLNLFHLILAIGYVDDVEAEFG